MEENMLNVERIRDVVSYIDGMTEKDPLLRFDMRNWYVTIPEETKVDNVEFACGTSMCLAGWAAYREEKKFLIRNVLFGDYDVKTALNLNDGDSFLTIPSWAKNYFGFSESEAQLIFSATEIDTTQALRQHINNVTGKRIFTEEEIMVE